MTYNKRADEIVTGDWVKVPGADGWHYEVESIKPLCGQVEITFKATNAFGPVLFKSNRKVTVLAK